MDGTEISIFKPKLTLRATSLNVQKFCVLPTVQLHVWRGFQNKQRLFLYTTLTL